MEYYQSYTVAIDATFAKKITDKLKFIQHTMQLLEITSTDRIIKATKDLQDNISGHPTEENMEQMDTVKNWGKGC